MKLYCLCQITGDVPAQARDSQGFGPPDGQCFMAPNRMAPAEEVDGEIHRPFMLKTPMTVAKTGVPQVVRNNSSDPVPPNAWPKTKEEMTEDLAALQDSRRHFPNVDMLCCPLCGATVALEG